MKISVVTPVFNEAGNLNRLYSELVGALSSITTEYEIIAVNDGSKDASREILRDLAMQDKRFKVLDLRANRGQTAALLAGLDHSSGKTIVTIDSDLENDPKDISALLKKLDEGYDVASGWRRSRWKGSWLTRKLPSVCANKLISFITGVKLHDYGCILKAYRREVISGVPLYGEMHRFIPAYAAWKGAKVAEVAVDHRPRKYGRSNYGISRIFKVILDLVMIRFMDKYMDKPIHFFGGVGFLAFGLGLASGFAALVLKLTGLRDFVATPLPIFSALFVIVGVQLIAMGIIAEILMRTYYGSQNIKSYEIADKINF